VSHGVEHFGQTGTIGDLYRHFGLDRHALAQSVLALSDGDRSALAALRSLLPS
jgi:pyruvate dehydrogenase E1 component